MNPKILLACPVYAEKEYAMPYWIEAAHKYTYPHDVLMVDNTQRSLDFFDRWKPQVPIVHLEFEGSPYFQPLTKSAEYIRRYALKNGYNRWLNLDSDEYSPDVDFIDYLLELMDSADCLTHASPNEQGDAWIPNGFGVVIFNRPAMECVSFDKCPTGRPHDAFWHQYVKENCPEISVKKTYGTRIIKHLYGSGRELYPSELKVSIPIVG